VNMATNTEAFSLSSSEVREPKWNEAKT
jgi:hypothetical protein